jgi:hypothetical protein
MQAIRRCSVTEPPETAVVEFTISTTPATEQSTGSEESDGAGRGDAQDENEDVSVDEDADEATILPPAKLRDPIRMFGVLHIPTSLRTAQSEAIKMVDIIPMLASVDAQMKEIEIQIRRARKHRGKADTVEKAQVLVEARTEQVAMT